MGKYITIVEYSDMKSGTDLISKLTKAISTSAAEPISEQADQIFSSSKREMSSHEARREDAYGRTLNNSINVNAK
jgi:hypothetical protein